jgi:twitching motility protein PilU
MGVVMTEMEAYLKLMVERGASDLFLSTGSPPYLKIDGATKVLDAPDLVPGKVKTLAYSLMTGQQCSEFERTLESNFAFSVEGVGRYRVNLYFQRGEVALVVSQCEFPCTEVV